jgi:ABC-type transport system substrate-binding protein
MPSPAAGSASASTARPADIDALKQVVTGSHLHLVRNEHYWGRDKAGNPLPYLDEVTIRIIKDETVLASALRSGDIDVAYLPNKEVDDFLADSRFNISRMAGGSIGATLVYNPDMAPMNDINLRRAIAHAINPADINKAVYFGKSSIADAGVWPPGTWAYQPSPAHLRYDLKLSREALVALGKPQGFEVDILTFNNPLHQQAIEIIRAQLARVGIKANIEVMTVGGATEKMFGGRKTSIYLTSWPRNPEPDTHSAYGFKAGGFYNASRKSTPALEAMITHGATTYDQTKRTEIYRRVTDMVLMQANWQPLLYGNFFVAAPKKIQNMNTFIAWDGRMQLKELWIRQQ